MAVETQLMELPFQSGIDQKVDSRWLTVGSQTSVTNGVFRKAGAIEKRFGYTLVSPAIIEGDGSLAVSKAFVGFGDAMNVCSEDFPLGLSQSDAHALYAYSPTSEANASTSGAFTRLDNITECQAWREPIIEWPLAVSSFDIAYVNGYIVSAFTALQNSSATVETVYVNVVDAANGATVISTSFVPSAGGSTSVRIAAGGVYAAIVMKEGLSVTANMYVAVLNTNTLAWGTTTNLITDFDTTAAAGHFWDVCWLPGSAANFFILYARRSGGVSSTKITFNAINASSVPSTSGSATFGPPAAHNAPGQGYAVSAGTSSSGSAAVMMSVAYDDGANTDVFTSYRAATAALTSVLAETETISNLTGTAPTLRLANRCGGGTPTEQVIVSNGTFVTWREIDSAGTVSNTGTILYQHILAGKPFLYDSHVYCNVACLSNLVAFDALGATVSVSQGNYTLLDLMCLQSFGSTAHSGRPVACLAPRIANTTTSTYTANRVVPQMSSVSSTEWLSVGTVAGGSSTRTGLNSFTYTFAGHRWQNVELGDVTYVNGGILTQFDGTRVTEVGFQHPPPGALSISPSNGAGALTVNGSYTYYVVYQWVDSRGQIQRSAASSGSVTMGAADDTNTIVINHQSMTLKQDVDSSFNPNVGIQIYRNQNGGAAFYQLLSDSAVLKSTPLTASQSYVDLIDDATLASNAFGFYPSQGGALEGYTMGSAVQIVKHEERLWQLLDDRLTWAYSTAVVVGEQVRFNDNWIKVMPEGPVTAGASMDGVFYSFTRSSIFGIAGEGPSEENQGNSLQEPQRLPTEVGCIDSRSVVVTSLGVFFQSLTGIYLLPRGGGSVMYIGQAVEDTLATYPVIRSAVVVPRHTEVRFACATSETSTTGVDIVYNYTFKAWSVFDKSVGTTSTYAAEATAVIGDDYYWCIAGQDSDNNIATSIFRENTDHTATSAHLDNATWIPLTVESVWSHPSSILGYSLFQQVQVLGVNNDPHDLTISTAIDYDDTYSFSETFNAVDIQLWSTPLEMATFDVPDQMAASLRIKLSDSTPTGLSATTGRGPTFVGLQLQVGNLGGPYRTPDAQTA